MRVTWAVENRIYYAALLRTHQAFVAPTQGPLLNYVQRVPLGVVAQITVCCDRIHMLNMNSLAIFSHKPFNHPLFIAVKKIAPALAAGNSVVVKPSELAPCTVLEFAEMAEAAGRECSESITWYSAHGESFQSLLVCCLSFLGMAKPPVSTLFPIPSSERST